MNTSSLVSASATRTASLPAVLAALLLGVAVLFGAGLSQADLLHNAAHDSRHALAFPCH